MDQTSVIPVHLPSGRVIRTLGKVAGLFSFSGEDNSYPLLCIVLEKSVHPLVLGSHFLRITQTLTKYTNRIKKVFSNILGLNFLGFLEAEQSLLAGYLNDHAVDIVPDTGSDIMVMSLSFADRLGLTISEGRQDKIRVQFIDGSEAYTLGRVRGVRYKSHWYVERGNRTIYGCDCDFYIIQHLPVDAIVSNEFVEEVGVFENHMYRLKSRQPKELQFGIYGIRYIESPCARQKEQSTLDHSFSAEMEESELHRRDAAVEDIEELLATDPSAAESRQRDERERRARNDRKRKHDEAQLSYPLQTSRIHTGGTTRSARQTGTGSLLHEANTDQRSAESSYQQMAGQTLTLAVGFDPESGQPQTKRRRFCLSRWLRGSRTG
ncbi:hypothetical protein N8I77_009606 [Diaporthe amygdali]|uniref:Uncharacterized protein n=1 Tax=Phomopsis amygdali TaxID=1214568 RepID=A0AAD9W141_PHOAM|nr:hypothetical protein N8I77_009606 [Diaporthe amygdali]